MHGYLTLWAWDGTLGRLHHALFVQVREQAGGGQDPTAAIIDSQSVKGAEKGALASIRRVSITKIDGKKRHILVDTLGLLLSAVVHPASVRTATGPSRYCARTGCFRSSR